MAIKLLAVRRILKARQRRLRGQVVALDRIAPRQHLVHRVFGQASRVISISITARDAEDALPQQLFQLVVNFANLSLIHQAVGQRLGQSQSPVGSFQQEAPPSELPCRWSNCATTGFGKISGNKRHSVVVS